MTKELRRLSILMLLMFIALFGATSWIQVAQSETLAENSRNTRALYDSYEVQRGSIIASGVPIASSVASDDVFSWQTTRMLRCGRRSPDTSTPPWGRQPASSSP